MTKTETLQVRLAPDELERLRDYSQSRGWSMAQAIRDLVRRLPDRRPRTVAITGDVEPASRAALAVQGSLIEAMPTPDQEAQNGQLKSGDLTGVDTVSRLPAYRVGAGTSGNGETESDGFLASGNSTPERPVHPSPERPGSLQARVGCLSKDSLSVVGEGVGRESEGTPRKPLKSVEIQIELPEWLEPHRANLVKWLENRRKKHKLQPEISRLSMKALEYAKSLGVLEQYCEVASDMQWQSLGFIGSREAIEKLAKENGIAVKNQNQGRPSMSPINYTLN